MKIEVFGPGCAKCHATRDNVVKALQELGLADSDRVAVTEIKDPRVMAQRGVLLTPGIAIDGVKVSEGKVPKVEEIEKWVGDRLPEK